jgi:nitrogen regulatory protein P-II 2
MQHEVARPHARPEDEGGGMKLIIAIIKPYKLEEVRDALAAIGVQGMTIAEVRGFGRQRGQTEIYRGAEYTTSFVPKVRLDIVVASDLAPKVLETIQQTASTGSIGDGKLFVIDVAQAVRIRTGELNEDAI